jgi:hypothetical protein
MATKNENIGKDKKSDHKEEKDFGENKAQVRAIIEILGKPKEHVFETIKKFINNIKNDENYNLEEEFIDEPVEQEDQKGVFSTYAEIVFNVKDINQLISFCFDYMPSSVEIIDPEEFFISSKHLTDLLNDMQARLHQSEMLTKQLFEENKAFNNTLNLLARNIIMISLAHKKLEISHLSRLSGIIEDKLKPFLDQMIKENKIKLEDNLYSIVDIKNE